MLTSENGTENHKNRGRNVMNTPAQVAENYVKAGIGKVNLSTLRMLILGIFAGMYIAFGALASQAASVTIASPSVAKFVGACIFPVGLMLVLVAGSELFTGNCLLVIPLLEKKVTLLQVIKSWILVYLGNMIGSLLVAFLACTGHVYTLYDSKMAETVVSTAAAKCALPFSDALIKGILCNILVCLAVWVSFAAKELAGKIIALYLPVVVFVLCGYEHSVANMYFIPAGLFASAAYQIPAKALTAGSFLLSNLLPVTIGNMIGGALIVGCGYWFCYLRKSNA